MRKIRVAPKKGLTVKDEFGAPLKSGDTVSRTPFIVRLLRDGDLLPYKEAGSVNAPAEGGE